MTTGQPVLYGLYCHAWLSSACSGTICLLFTSWVMVGTLALVIFVLRGGHEAPKRQPIKEEREREGLGCWWPSFHWKQQPTDCWHSWYIEYWLGHVIVVERVGGGVLPWFREGVWPVYLQLLCVDQHVIKPFDLLHYEYFSQFPSISWQKWVNLLHSFAKITEYL